MEVLYPRCAGLYVHKDLVVVESPRRTTCRYPVCDSAPGEQQVVL